MSKESKTLITAFVLSVVFHIVLLFYSNRYAEKKKEALSDLREVELLEEKVGPRVNPKVLKMLAQKQAEKEKTKDSAGTGPSINLSKRRPSIGVENAEGPKIKLEKTVAEPQVEGPSISLDNAQTAPNIQNARIDLSSASDNVSVEGADVVLAFSGKGKSTREILKEQPVSGGISLEHSGVSDAQGAGLISGSGSVGGRIKLVGTGGTSLKDIEKESPRIVGVRKKKPAISLRRGRSTSRKSGPLISLSGPLKNRKVIRKIAPSYPHSALKEGEEGTCVLKFWVSKDGHVKPNILILRSTGYPVLDRSAMNALKMWVFGPSSRDDDWGVLTVIFQLL